MLHKLEVPVPYLKDFKHFLVIGVLYLYIFQPPIIDKYFYIGVECAIFVVYSLLNKGFLVSFFTKFRAEVVLLFSILMYSLLRDLISGNIVFFDRFAAWAFQSFAVGFLIIHWIEKRNYKSRHNSRLIPLFYWATFVAAVFTFLLVTNPTLDALYKSISDSAYYDLYSTFDTRYRAYGISENLTFTYSYILGLFGGYTLLIIQRNYLLALPFFLFVFGVYFNARIGFIAVLLFVIYILVFERSWAKLIISFLGCWLVYSLILLNFPAISASIESNKTWIMAGLDGILGESSLLSIYVTDFVVLPDSPLEWIIGTGESLFGRSDVQSSDIGYILQLYYGGLILFSIILSFIIYTCRRLLLSLGWNHWYVIVFILSILILNFKGFIFAATPGGRMLFVLYVYFICINVKGMSENFARKVS